MRYVSLLVFMVFFSACDDKGGGNQRGGNGQKGSVEPEKSVSLSKVVSVSLGSGDACAVDEQNHVACWRHPQKFIPSSPGSSRGGYEVDYPKKTNAELAGFKFSYIASMEKSVCTVTTDGKVLCFLPSDCSSKTVGDLATLGRFKKVAISDGFVCAIDTFDILTCHSMDFGPVTGYDHASAEEIIDFAEGNYLAGGSYKLGGCWINASNTLACAQIDDYPLAPAPREECSMIKPASIIHTGSVVTLSVDKKALKFFRFNRRIAVEEVDTLNLNSTYVDLATTGVAVCLVATSTHEVKCRAPKNFDALPKRTNQDLRSENVAKISVGHNLICGLRLDKTAFCWQGQDYQPGVPRVLTAE